MFDGWAPGVGAVGAILPVEAVLRDHCVRMQDRIPVEPDGQRVGRLPEFVQGAATGIAFAQAMTANGGDGFQRLVEHTAQLFGVGKPGVKPVAWNLSRGSVGEGALERDDHPPPEECRRGVLALRRWLAENTRRA